MMKFLKSLDELALTLLLSTLPFLFFWAYEYFLENTWLELVLLFILVFLPTIASMRKTSAKR